MIGIRITERGGSVDENQIHHAIEQAYQLIVEAHRNMTDIWRTHVLFTRQWWFGVGLSICPWLFWMGFRDKRATGQFLLSGLTMIIVAGPAWDCHGTLALSLGSRTVHAGQFSMEFFTSSRHGYVLTPVQVWHTSVVQSSPIWGIFRFCGRAGLTNGRFIPPRSLDAYLFFSYLCWAVLAGFKHCQEGHRFR